MRNLLVNQDIGFSIDFSGMGIHDDELTALKDTFEKASAEMDKIESGCIKNPDEHRKVTHFTDRIDYPSSELFAKVEEFAYAIREGQIKSSCGKRFNAVVVNGIGGSALGPQLMQYAINGPYWNELSLDKRCGALKIYFLDNTDTAEFVDLLQVLDPQETLHLIISKSGGTKETKNNMIAMEEFYQRQGIPFGPNAIAITMNGSELYQHATRNGFLKIFEMADSIGGRTSETSIVGHVPATLAGIDFDKFLEGACKMDSWTRPKDFLSNPAMILAAMWYIAGNGKGNRNMVIVPYSDRLILLSRYLQQLVMESLGKEHDLAGNVVHQGLNVFGNKGGTDAHAFIQQLNDGRDDFFITFIEVLKDSAHIAINDEICMGDYLHGFLFGLDNALRSKGRKTIMIKLNQLTEFELGQIIALYERAVAFYAEFIGINAFHQPGVQAYKLAASGVLDCTTKLNKFIKQNEGFSGLSSDFAAAINEGCADNVEGILDKIALNSKCVSRKFDSKKNRWVYSVNK